MLSRMFARQSLGKLLMETGMLATSMSEVSTSLALAQRQLQLLKRLQALHSTLASLQIRQLTEKVQNTATGDGLESRRMNLQSTSRQTVCTVMTTFSMILLSMTSFLVQKTHLKLATENFLLLRRA